MTTWHSPSLYIKNSRRDISLQLLSIIMLQPLLLIANVNARLDRAHFRALFISLYSLIQVLGSFEEFSPLDCRRPGLVLLTWFTSRRVSQFLAEPHLARYQIHRRRCTTCSREHHDEACALDAPTPGHKVRRHRRANLRYINTTASAIPKYL